MDKRIKYYSRKFLNKKTGTALIECSMDNQDYMGGVDSSVVIADCNRRINLDFSSYKTGDVHTSITKLSLLIDELCTLREVYMENADAITTSIVVEREKYKKLRAARAKDKKNEL